MSYRVFAVLMVLALGMAACTATGPITPSAVTPSAVAPTAQRPRATIGSPETEEWLTAQEAVSLAYAALTADWKPVAKLAFVGRYSRFCNVECSPLIVEEDAGIGADGRQAHWVVIFANETASPAEVFYVENGQAKLVASDIAMIRPNQLFDREGWVDSTEIQFRSSQKVGLELKTNDTFIDFYPELASHPLLWVAETSFGHYDLYDASTGIFIMSK